MDTTLGGLLENRFSNPCPCYESLLTPNTKFVIFSTMMDIIKAVTKAVDSHILDRVQQLGIKMTHSPNDWIFYFKIILMVIGVPISLVCNLIFVLGALSLKSKGGNNKYLLCNLGFANLTMTVVVSSLTATLYYMGVGFGRVNPLQKYPIATDPLFTINTCQIRAINESRDHGRLPHKTAGANAMRYLTDFYRFNHNFLDRISDGNKRIPNNDSIATHDLNEWMKTQEADAEENENLGMCLCHSSFEVEDYEFDPFIPIQRSDFRSWFTIGNLELDMHFVSFTSPGLRKNAKNFMGILWTQILKLARDCDANTLLNIMCRLQSGIFISCLSVSLHTLALLAIDRFLFITQAIKYHMIMTPSINMIIVLLTWFIDFILAYPLYDNAITNQTHSSFICIWKFCSVPWFLKFYLTIGLTIPLIIVLIANMFVLKIAYKQKSQIYALSKAVHINIPSQHGLSLYPINSRVPSNRSINPFEAPKFGKGIPKVSVEPALPAKDVSIGNVKTRQDNMQTTNEINNRSQPVLEKRASSIYTEKLLGLLHRKSTQVIVDPYLGGLYKGKPKKTILAIMMINFTWIPIYIIVFLLKPAFDHPVTGRSILEHAYLVNVSSTAIVYCVESNLEDGGNQYNTLYGIRKTDLLMFILFWWGCIGQGILNLVAQVLMSRHFFVVIKSKVVIPCLMYVASFLLSCLFSVLYFIIWLTLGIVCCHPLEKYFCPMTTETRMDLFHRASKHSYDICLKISKLFRIKMIDHKQMCWCSCCPRPFDYSGNYNRPISSDLRTYDGMRRGRDNRVGSVSMSMMSKSFLLQNDEGLKKSFQYAGALSPFDNKGTESPRLSPNLYPSNNYIVSDGKEGGEEKVAKIFSNLKKWGKMGGDFLNPMTIGRSKGVSEHSWSTNSTNNNSKVDRLLRLLQAKQRTQLKKAAQH